jgi:hypothetical protein
MPGFFVFLGQRPVSASGILQRTSELRFSVTRSEIEDPVVWLLLLERGRRTNDFELAARAKRELKRLGIRVIYRTARDRKRGKRNVV